MENKGTYIGTMIALATVAFGLIAATAWNAFITALIGMFLRPGTGIWALLVYAVLVTILAIVVVNNLGRLQDKQIGPKS